MAHVAHVALTILVLGALIVAEIDAPGEVSLSIILNMRSQTSKGMVSVHVVLVVVVERFGRALVQVTIRCTSSLDGNVVVVRLTWPSAVVVHAIFGISSPAVVAIHWGNFSPICVEIWNTTHLFFLGFVGSVTRPQRKKFIASNVF